MTDPHSKLFDPADYDIPAAYRHWQGDAAENHIGPFFFTMDGDNPRTACRLESRHCNAHGTVHGGVLMAFADYTLCLGANGGGSDGVVTISQNNDFLAPANAGELLEGRGELLRRGKSLVFMRCGLYVDDRLVLASSAVVKRLRSPG